MLHLPTIICKHFVCLSVCGFVHDFYTVKPMLTRAGRQAGGQVGGLAGSQADSRAVGQAVKRSVGWAVGQVVGQAGVRQAERQGLSWPKAGFRS